MKSIRCWGELVIVFISILSMFTVATFPGAHHEGPSTSARVLAAGEPIAVIAPMPDYVSNARWTSLDGSGSHDSDGGIILNFTWEITQGESNTTYLYGQTESHLFKTPGLYKILLTVTDNESKSGRAFTAVVSVIDVDLDGLPDSWEINYFYALNQTAEGDFDNDGYTNLEEYARGSDPTKKDPQPSLVQMLKENWLYLVVIAAVIIGAVLATLPFLRKKRKRREKRKIDAALAIERELEHGGK